MPPASEGQIAGGRLDSMIVGGSWGMLKSSVMRSTAVKKRGQGSKRETKGTDDLPLRSTSSAEMYRQNPGKKKAR